MIDKTEPAAGQVPKKTKTTKMGRPSLFTDELAREICALVISGTNLNQICSRDDMPNRDTLYSWLASKQDFSDNYARACKIRREFKFEALQEIVDQEEDVQRARLKVDVIKWQLGKEEPKKYGDKLDITSKDEKIERGMTIEAINEVLARAEAEAKAESDTTDGK